MYGNMYGLMQKGGGIAIPLKDVQVNAEVNTFTAKVMIALTYVNDNSDSALEVEFKFPLDEKAAIYHFEAIIDGKSIVGEVQEKSKAERTYSDAISAGKGAYLLSQESSDMFSMSVGNLPPKQSVILKIGYVAELSVEGDTVIFPITNLAPDYISFFFEAQLQMVFPIIEVVCSENKPCKILFDKSNSCNATIRQQGGFVPSGTEMRYEIKLNQPHQPCIIKETEGQNSAYALHFLPNTDYKECESELIFLLDRSGSMGGSSIEQLKQTMFQVLKHLPQIAVFNIIGFGSHFTSLFKESLPCSPPNIGTARKHISTLKADLGGTDILRPLQSIFSDPPKTAWKGRQKIIFVLTDGQVSDRDQVLDCVAVNSQKARVFSLGIGCGVDNILIKKMAENGKGTSLFTSGLSDEMEKSVIKLLHTAVAPSLEKVELTWVKKDGQIVNNYVDQAPIKLPPIYNHQLYTVYAMFPLSFELSHVLLKATGKAGSYSKTISCSKEKEISGNLIHRLAAKTLIRELEEKSSVVSSEDKQKIVDLSLKYNIASTFASFVIVEPRKTPVLETMTLSEISVQKRNQTKYCSTINSLTTVQSDLEATKQMMIENIDKVLERGEALQLLDQCEVMSASHSLKFYKNSRSLRRRRWIPNILLLLLILIVILLMILLVVGLLVKFLV